jgi:glycosyltransferase involved in cell wall biosynthesis
MRVSVVVSSYNQRGKLELALEALRLQDEKPFEVIVADDGSTDGTLEWLDDQMGGRWPFDLRYVTRRHSWYRLASANNLAAARARAGRILFTNADQVHCPASVRAHARIPDEVVGAGVFRGIDAAHSESVGMVMVRDFRMVEALSSLHPSAKTNVGYIGRVDPNKNPIGVWGGNFSVPAAKFFEIGGYDMAYDIGWGGEENDLVARCVASGCRVEWVTCSVIYHLDHAARPYARTRLGSNLYARKGK